MPDVLVFALLAGMLVWVALVELPALASIGQQVERAEQERRRSRGGR
jgi:hypothetical protein